MKHFIIIISIFLSFTTFSQETELETSIQRGHLGAVKTAAFSSDGNFLITGGRDKTARLWEVRTGREIRMFQGHIKQVQTVCFSPDGKKIATGSTDGAVKLWDVTNGKLIKTFKENKRINSIVFTNDSKYLLIGGYSKKLKIINIETGQSVREIKVIPNIGTGTGVGIQVSKDNKSILVSEDNRRFKLFDFEKGEMLHEFNAVEKGSCGGCASFAKFTPDGKNIVTVSNSGPLVLWNIKTGKKIKTYANGLKNMNSIDITPDGNLILISDEKKVYIYNKNSGKLIHSYSSQEKNINSAIFSPNSKYFLTTGDEGSAILRKISNGKKVTAFIGYLNKSDYGTKLDREEYWEYWARTYFDFHTQVKLSPDGKLLIIGKKDSIAKVIYFETGKKAYNLVGHSGAVICYDFSPDGKLIATGSSDKTIKIWNATDGSLIRTLKGHWDMVFSVHFDKTGKKLLSTGWDGDAYIWDVDTGKKLQWIKGVKAYTSDFSKIGNYIVTGGFNKLFSFWEIDTKEKFRDYIGHTDVVTSFAFNPDGRTVISTSWDGKINVFDVISGFQLHNIDAHSGKINTVIFSKYGKVFYTGSSDGKIAVWNSQTGKLIKSFRAHKSAVTSLQLTPDDQTLISCSIEGIIKVWDIHNAKEIYTYYQLTRNDWFVKTEGGFFDGNAGAKKYIYYVKGMKTYNVDQFFEDFYRPGLLQQAYKTRGLINENKNLDDYLKKSPPPSVKFKSAFNDSVFKEGIVTLEYQITDNGGGIDEVKIMQNGKRIITDFNSSNRMKRGRRLNKKMQLMLVPGKNKIQISAFSPGRIESNIAEQNIIYETDENLPNCFILSIGINKYENESLNLNYAKADAKAFSDEIKKHSKALFNNMYFYNLSDKNASKTNIVNAVNDIAAKGKAEDVFIFYYAGHGSMIGTDFYFIPTNCIRIYDLDDLTKNALDAEFMQKKFNAIKALKQIMILDACQSGGATEVLAQRGAVKEKAIAQLSRSTGIHVLASAGSEQFAVEFKSIGHGLFTYVLLKALEGNADGSPLDGKVTIYELKSYLDDQVPEYTSKFKGVRQYPYSYSGGNDFPLTLDDNR